MTGLPWLTLVAATAWLLSGAEDLQAHTGIWSMNELLAWRELAIPLLCHAVTVFTRLLHQIVPAWPLALLLPLAWASLLWRMSRRPLLYARGRLSTSARAALVVVGLAGCLWLAMETAAALQSLPEWMELLRMALRWLATSATVAATQVGVICLVIAWDDPTPMEQGRDGRVALDRAMSRWPGVLALAGFNLLWLPWSSRAHTGRADWRDWLLVEVLLVFAALPVAVARVPGHFIDQGGRALQALWRSFWPMLGITLTAVAIVMLVHYMLAVTSHAVANHDVRMMIFLPLRALVLATVHNWLFLAAVFTLLRHGFRTDATGDCSV